MPTSALADRFRRVCRQAPNAIAVRALVGDDPLTFSDLALASTTIVRALTDVGVGPGATVVLRIGNRPAFFPAFLACMELGAALVPLGEATDAETTALIREAGAVAVVTDRALPLRVAHARPLLSGLQLLKLEDPDNPSDYGESVVLKLTSGSTDLPKAAITSEMHLINDGRHIIDAMGIETGDINLGCIPLSHSYALGNIVIPCLWQGTGVVLPQAFNPAQFVRDVSASGATIFPGVPFMFERLKSSGQVDRLPASLRLLITAGARIGVDTVSWFRQQLDRKVHSFYGTSETGGISYDDSDSVSDPLHVGRALPDTTITIREPEPGQTAGRIFVSGDALASHYANAESDDPRSMFIDGGFLTGDVGHWDGDGRLVLTGRVSALINVAGRKVDPVEVERALLQLPGIADALVFGMECDMRGQQVVAFVVRADATLTPLAIRQRCAATISTHKIPRRFVFVDSFPVDGRGKIDRRALQSLASSADEA